MSAVFHGVNIFCMQQGNLISLSFSLLSVSYRGPFIFCEWRWLTYSATHHDRIMMLERCTYYMNLW
ncbi:hypothetical protein HMPREF0454_01808 [Hafnia alvei ATCC 51873]|uniref:Uncharacterized protein n=1 Tax=Hafnia alvei ATCC 51873 TaxID=1002364 RepID=G9Y5J9_HAFAL|nr:hypothetical protein HMPREF0454_01808 [Hafnia alvei ATCC 51873]